MTSPQGGIGRYYQRMIMIRMIRPTFISSPNVKPFCMYIGMLLVSRRSALYSNSRRLVLWLSPHKVRHLHVMPHHMKVGEAKKISS